MDSEEEGAGAALSDGGAAVGGAGPQQSGAAAAGDVAALIRRLRQIVPLFAASSKQPNRAELQTELQRHRGGAANLPAMYQRKRPPGHEHLSSFASQSCSS